MREVNAFEDQVNWQDLRRATDPSKQLYEVEMASMLARVDNEVRAVIGEPWIRLKQMNDTFVAIHTIMVLAVAVQDPLFANKTPAEQNALKWACLLHDIAKLSIPVIEGKDHVHPFKSASIALDIMERYRMIPDLTEDKRAQLS